MIDVGQTSIIGIGAGGGATVYTLNSLKHLSGIINLVDPDVIKLSNLNRYVWAFSDHAHRQVRKVDVAYDMLSSAHEEIMVRKFFGPYIQFTDELRKMGGADLVISTVDTGKARQEIQWDTPRVILDGSATQYGDYVILRVYFGEGQCLGCKHQAGNAEEHQLYQVLSGKTGLGTGVIEQLKKDGVPFSEEHIRQMSDHISGQEPPEFALPEPGMSFSDWYQQQCGRLKLPELRGTEIPIPFVPTMAGILLAGEIIKERYFPDSVIRNRFSHSMLNTPSAQLLYFKRPRPDCVICQDPIVQKRYGDIWHSCVFGL